MQDKPKEWIKCPVCQKPFMKHISGIDSVYETKCGRCKNTIKIYSAGKTVKL